MSLLRDAKQALPTRFLLGFLVVWLLLGALNLTLHVVGLDPGTPLFFPISIFRGPELHPGGFVYSVAFACVCLWVLARPPAHCLTVWGWGVLLIALGNLAQGGVDAAFYQPLYVGGKQFFHDAMAIEDATFWLAGFNDAQTTLGVHAATHPPFAVLLHHVLGGNGHELARTALALFLLSTLAIPLFWSAVRTLGSTADRASRLALLFAVVPAVNVYSAVSLDGVTAMLGTAALSGMLRVARHGPRPGGIALLAAGLVGANLLSFGGVFFVGVVGLLAGREILVERRKGLTLALALSVLLSAGLFAILAATTGYNHLEAFVRASQIENPEGFRALSTPLEYMMTRIEGAAEIALFLSPGVLALLCRRWDPQDQDDRILLAALVVLGGMLLAGAYRTGETARACLFLYPFLLLGLRRVPNDALRGATALAAVQTLVMQTFGHYFW